MRQVYWPEEEKWFPGIVTAFNPAEQKHTVDYEDGDVDDMRLFMPGLAVQPSNLSAH
jgi:hypothetical protein